MDTSCLESKDGAAKDLASLKIIDAVEDSEGKFEKFKALDNVEERSPIEADEMEASYPYLTFEESILENCDDILDELPSLFTDETREISDEDSSVEYDDDNPSDNAANIERSKSSDSKGQTGHIKDNARNICEVILFGFQLAVTDDIFKLGEINYTRFRQTENAKKMKKSLEEHDELWKDKVTDQAHRLQEVHHLLDAISERSYTDILKAYYRSQHRHTLKNHDEPLPLPVHIDEVNLDQRWIGHLMNAITAINEATPGINLYRVTDINKSKIRIGVDDVNLQKKAYTKYGGSFLNSQKKKEKKPPFIHLGNEWEDAKMKGTSIHELMHALSFHHEMLRSDAHLYMSLNQKNEHEWQKKNSKGLTRFDPFSVMMYKEGVHFNRIVGDSIWELKQSSERCQELSELNKVALNMTFKPCKSHRYQPILHHKTKMLYCGRNVMINHNQVSKATTDYKCGPNNWANCPACRVIIKIEDKDNNLKQIPQLDKCLQLGKWQGLSGLFYCGKEDPDLKTDIMFSGQNAICGPDTGIPCHECGRMLYQKYTIKHCDSLLAFAST